MHSKIVTTPAFDLLTFGRLGGHSGILNVYLEGDGYAWITATRPSNDPTPRDPLALRLAARDPHGDVAWIARPCQYRGGTSARGCNSSYWTDSRFAPEVVEATSKALDTLKSGAGAEKIRLIGYSGGGTLATLLAARRGDVDLLVTLAGILDVETWTKSEGLTPLTGSLDPARQTQRLEGRRQIHFTGSADKTVPPTSAFAFADRFADGRHPPVVVIEGIDHACCWVERWPALLDKAAREARAP